MPPVVVTGRHRPHEVTILLFSAFVGLAFIVGAKAPGSVEEVLPVWLRWAWYLLLLTSGLVGLAGLLMRDVYTTLTFERAAMWGQSAAFAIYALAIFTLAGWRGLAAGGLCTAFASASAWRLRQVSRDVATLRAATREDR